MLTVLGHSVELHSMPFCLLLYVHMYFHYTLTKINLTNFIAIHNCPDNYLQSYENARLFYSVKIAPLRGLKARRYHTAILSSLPCRPTPNHLLTTCMSIWIKEKQSMSQIKNQVLTGNSPGKSKAGAGRDPDNLDVKSHFRSSHLILSFSHTSLYSFISRNIHE